MFVNKESIDLLNVQAENAIEKYKSEEEDLEDVIKYWEKRYKEVCR